MKLSFLFALLFASQIAFTLGRSFLDGEAQEDMDNTSLELTQEAFEMASVAAEFQHSTLLDQSRRIKHLKATLLPMFKSLPKNPYGRLAPQVARYALHRLFEQEHSWSVNGLSPVRATDDDVFGQLTADVTPKGISMDNLAMLAAVLEDRIHKETVVQLKTTYNSLHQTEGEEMSAAALDVLINKYMTIYISGMREYNLTKSELEEQRSYMAGATQDWGATTAWIHEAEQDAVRSRKPCGHGITDCSFDFQDTTYVAEKLLREYGQFNSGECKRLKATLLRMEDHGTGRLSLANFYKEGISGTWEFNEKVDYLRDLGTLDESVPGQPRVIVANYVNSWVNCLTSSSLYSVCCRNECEDIMAHFERHIESPTASPDVILQLVRSFHSDDFAVSNDISELLLTRLHSIADRHHGMVPLQGRLFAQWLHHVFPQNCPYPHKTGATNPLTPDQWMKERGHSDIKASQEEITRAVNNVAVDVKGGVRINTGIVKFEDEDDALSMPWSDVEEVFVSHISKEAPQNARFFRSYEVVLLEVSACIALVLAAQRFSRTFRFRKALHKLDYEKLTI